jgi:hypothetical protein
MFLMVWVSVTVTGRDEGRVDGTCGALKSTPSQKAGCYILKNLEAGGAHKYHRLSIAVYCVAVPPDRLGADR